MPPNANPSSSPSPEVWSALVDGEATDAEVQAALSAWRRAPVGAATWHAYHLIGDTLRSSDLSAPPDRDARLLRAVRARLEAEPVVLAPAAPGSSPGRDVHAARRRWRRWTGSAAMVAGVGAVGAMVWLTQSPSAPAASLAQRPAMSPLGAGPAGGAVAVPTATTATAPLRAGSSSAALPAAATAGPMLRDPRLDEYFAAHRQLGSGRAVGTPAGFAAPDVAAAPR